LRPIAIVDLGFGDAGKGLVTDHLTRSLGARLVVRFNGGAQAGHNVLTPEGRHHTFSQLGSGTFVPGVRTHLSRRFVLHPTAMLEEARVLATKGHADALERTSVDGEAFVVTPFHQAAGRVRELARRERHGSCGVGVGEVMRDATGHALEAVRVRDLADPPSLAARLECARERLHADIVEAGYDSVEGSAAEREWHILRDRAFVAAFIDATRPLLGRITVASDEIVGDAIRRRERVLFEGAQGVLLDEDWGFHPHTTWSRCTFANVDELLGASGIGSPAVRIGVARAYAHRHGPGPLPTESAQLCADLAEPHNLDGPWQGPFRAGWPDLVLARYARRACGHLDALALTHLDVTAARPRWPVCSSYEAGRVVEWHAIAPADLHAREESTRRLARMQPDYRDLDGADLPHAICEAYAAPVVLTSRGPTARHVELVGGAPW
jgi:adenylosuccinate synthase